LIAIHCSLGLITQRSEVQILPPLPIQNQPKLNETKWLRGNRFLALNCQNAPLRTFCALSRKSSANAAFLPWDGEGRGRWASSSTRLPRPPKNRVRLSCLDLCRVRKSPGADGRITQIQKGALLEPNPEASIIPMRTLNKARTFVATLLLMLGSLNVHIAETAAQNSPATLTVEAIRKDCINLRLAGVPHLRRSSLSD
jgi:hypothetical protein